MDKQHFDLKAEHLALLNRANVRWESIEFGAPAIDGKRPYGNSDVYGDIAEILDIEPSGDEWDPFTEEQEDHMRTLHEETETALQIVLACSGDVHPGAYEADAYRRNWRRSQQPEQGRYERTKRALYKAGDALQKCVYLLEGTGCNGDDRAGIEEAMRAADEALPEGYVPPEYDDPA